MSAAIKVATYNIHYGVGLDGELNVERIVDAVQDADVIALQEVEVGWDRSSNTDQPALIQELLPDHEAAWGPTIDVRKVDNRGVPVGRGLRRQFGNMLLSRFPIISIRNLLFPKYGGTRFLEMQRGALEAVVQTPVGLLRVYSMHLCNLSQEQRERQLALFLDHHKRAADEGPVLSGDHADASWTREPPLPPMPREAILLGDLNCEDTTDAYTMIAGEKSEKYGRLTKRGGFVDAWAALVRTHAVAAACNTTVAYGQNRRIDYCFVSSEIAPWLKSAEVRTNAKGSDHFPLVVTLESPGPRYLKEVGREAPVHETTH
jgi:endonuclease/exonuclease/phosphatase family metal-dependent hydrolase